VETPLAVRAARLVDGGVLPVGLPDALAAPLAEADAEMRSGITYRDARSEPLAAIRRVADDLRAFRERHGLDHVTVVNLCSTEPPADPHPAHADADALERALHRGLGVLPPSSLYALAAIQEGCAFIDFTPSTGARLPAIEALAEERGVPLGGSDGKTGETLIKTALAPVFAARALRVRSWAGANLLGGGDGEALADPVRAESKVRSKARCLEEILGYAPEAPVRIDCVRDMGEWKTAWDHVAFEGFLGVRMKLQFTWDGCDSALAAPLVLDLGRLGALALARGDAGFVPELAFFFKDPAGTTEHALERQFEMLRAWAAEGVRA
jgi:myo-inositol-1-phosphate synthase